MNKLFFTLFFIYFSQVISAQDTLLLITGRKIVVSSVDLHDYTIAYRKIEPGSKLKKIDPERVFSIIYRDGKERIIFQTDSLDPLDFKVEEMRNFIRGEQDATELYKNTAIKVSAFSVGFGFSFFGHFYGLVGPPIFATIVGSVSPDVQQKLTFNVSGNAAGVLGIPEGKYMNNVTGTNANPLILKDQKLKIANKSFKFKSDISLDSAITTINSEFKCMRVHASNDNGKIKLYKSETPALITDPSYLEGFEKNVREYKIKNSMLYGFAGFIVGFITFNKIFD